MTHVRNSRRSSIMLQVNAQAVVRSFGAETSLPKVRYSGQRLSLPVDYFSFSCARAPRRIPAIA